MQFRVDVADMGIDGMLAEEYPFRDGSLREPLHQMTKDFSFSLGKAVFCGGRIEA